MIGLDFLRHGNRFAARVRRRYFSAERISTAGNASAFAGYVFLVLQKYGLLFQVCQPAAVNISRYKGCCKCPGMFSLNGFTCLIHCKRRGSVQGCS